MLLIENVTPEYLLSDFDILLDGILLSYDFCSHAGVLSFLFLPKKTQILLDKHENYSTRFNPIFVQVSLISLIYTPLPYLCLGTENINETEFVRRCFDQIFIP